MLSHSAVTFIGCGVRGEARWEDVWKYGRWREERQGYGAAIYPDHTPPYVKVHQVTLRLDGTGIPQRSPCTRGCHSVSSVHFARIPGGLLPEVATQCPPSTSHASQGGSYQRLSLCPPSTSHASQVGSYQRLSLSALRPLCTHPRGALTRGCHSAPWARCGRADQGASAR